MPSRKTHGHTRPPTRTYRAWQMMKQRCYNPKTNGYARYGGAGIRVFVPWLQSFDRFLADVGEAPSARHTLDRKNPRGHYVPSNVRWATVQQQALNRSTNRRITFKGRTMTCAEWARHFGIARNNLPKSIRRRGEYGALAYYEERAWATAK